MRSKRNRFCFIALSAVVSTAAIFTAHLPSELIARANNYYLEISPDGPLNQTWTNTNQITTDDNWTGVVAIEGFRGAGLSPSPGANPQTILADSPNNPLDVTANETNPLTSIADGVAEFEITDPTVALKGSDAATAPNLVIHINGSLGCNGKFINLRYRLRDIDASANNAVTQIATQFRTGASGNYTNIPAGYTADATTGPNQATFQKFVNIVLPVSSISNPLIDIRIITTNATGADEWVGVDDINVNCIHSTVGQASIYGRIVDANGRGISGARVMILDASTQETQTALTNGFGIYSFNNLPAGNVYSVTAQHKRFTFQPNMQSIELLGDREDVNFVSVEANSRQP